MLRCFVSTLALLLLYPAVADADVIFVRKGKRIEPVGIKKEVKGTNGEKVTITPQNIDIFLDESTGIILVDGYNGVTIAKSARAAKANKGTTYPSAQVVSTHYNTEPDALLDGLEQMSLGAYAQAIGRFRNVMNDPDVRAVYKHRASYRLGMCYYFSGRIKECVAHFKAWKGVNSHFTPKVQQTLAIIYTGQKKYPNARARYQNIAKLPDISENWKYMARLGQVRVDIAERKYKKAESAAAQIARETRSKPSLADARTMAIALQGDAIYQSGATDRLPAAQTLLESGAKVEGASAGSRATLFMTLGHVLYTRRMQAEARFPYLRAALLYGEGSGFTNAGLCFVDLADTFEKDGDQKKSDAYFLKGMRLLATAAGRYRDPAARKHYRKHKARYEKLKEK